ncbi:MAG: MurNAc alpha-1-phosphate uridylyltransferase [Oleiphilaceae bacterium]|jgi:MurNAc alpha-1-phosphate uridylyltransferase
MKAMILAAGLGKRMRPLTDHTPKPLLKVAGRYLIEFHIERLASSGISDIIINTHWLGEQLPVALGDGARWGVKLHYLHEDVLLETAGGIHAALPLLSDGDQAFLVVNGDVYTEMNLSAWLEAAPVLNAQHLAYLALVRNPEHNKKGDFCYDAQTSNLSLIEKGGLAYTYSGIALFHPALFKKVAAGSSPLGPLLKKYIAKQQVLGGLISEYWLDVGTPERLAELKQRVEAKNV